MHSILSLLYSETTTTLTKNSKNHVHTYAVLIDFLFYLLRIPSGPFLYNNANKAKTGTKLIFPPAQRQP